MENNTTQQNIIITINDWPWFEDNNHSPPTFFSLIILITYNLLQPKEERKEK